MLRLVLLLVLLALPVRAEEVVAALSQNRVSIDTNFDGSEILIFGAIKRESPIPEGELHVIVTVSGPSVPHRRPPQEPRLRHLGEHRTGRDRPRPLVLRRRHLRPWSDGDLRNRGPAPQDLDRPGDPLGRGRGGRFSPNFTEALIRLRLRGDLYQTNLETVDFTRRRCSAPPSPCPRT
jgi:hypothetical protein